MRTNSILIAAALSLLVVGAASAKATPCKDDKGKFIKCPAAAVTAPPKGPCKDAKGKFIKCVAPAAVTAPTPAPTTTAKASPPVTPAAKPVTTGATTTAAVVTTGKPAGATAQCKDKTFSMSKVHSGACSHHGGVATWL